MGVMCKRVGGERGVREEEGKSSMVGGWWDKGDKPWQLSLSTSPPFPPPLGFVPLPLVVLSPSPSLCHTGHSHLSPAPTTTLPHPTPPTYTPSLYTLARLPIIPLLLTPHVSPSTILQPLSFPASHHSFSPHPFNSSTQLTPTPGLSLV